MPRNPRIHFEGATYHVMIRGNAGEEIFFSDNDRNFFYKLITLGIERFHFQLHAFCLMTNHVHFAVEVCNTPLSTIMHNLTFRYAQWINSKRDRRGHLFQGRYKAILVDSDEYLRDLIRYIHLNPVRANMVTAATDYRWSSHHTYLGFQELPWVTTERMLNFFSQNKNQALLKYQDFILSYDNADSEKFSIDVYKDNEILGEKNPSTEIDCQSKQKLAIDDLVMFVAQYNTIETNFLFKNSNKNNYSKLRAQVAWLAKKLNTASVSEVAR